MLLEKVHQLTSLTKVLLLTEEGAEKVTLRLSQPSSRVSSKQTQMHTNDGRRGRNLLGSATELILKDTLLVPFTAHQ